MALRKLTHFFLLFFSPCFGAQESVPSEVISVAFSLRKVGQETGTGRLDGNQERELRGLFSAARAANCRRGGGKIGINLLRVGPVNDSGEPAAVSAVGTY